MLVLSCQLRMCQITENTQTMIKSNCYDTALCKTFTIVAVQMSIPLGISAAMKIYTNRKLFIRALCRSPYIQIQAVFTARPLDTIKLFADQIDAALRSTAFLIADWAPVVGL